MHSNILRLVLAAILSVTVLVTAQASALSPAHQHKRDRVEKKYTKLYYTVKHNIGGNVQGRNIRRDGIKTRTGPRMAKTSELQRSIRTYKRWLAPPKAPVATGDRIPTGPVASTPHQAGGRYAIPDYIVQCESGGSYTAQNSSGAYGAYQIMPGTARAYGCSLATPSGQDRCADKIWKDSGSSAWSCG